MLLEIPKDLDQFITFLKESQKELEAYKFDDTYPILCELLEVAEYGVDHDSIEYYNDAPCNWLPQIQVEGIISMMNDGECSYYDILSDISQLLISLES